MRGRSRILAKKKKGNRDQISTKQKIMVLKRKTQRRKTLTRNRSPRAFNTFIQVRIETSIKTSDTSIDMSHESPGWIFDADIGMVSMLDNWGSRVGREKWCKF